MFKCIDPIAFTRLCWPHVYLYDKQREILYSVRDNDETFAPAGNALGKDFVSALCALWFFCSRRPARVVTTSVQGAQLYDVLWAEIRNFIDTSVVELPIVYNHMQIRQRRNDGTYDPKSSLVGQVINKGESLLGRHLARSPFGEPRTLCIFDEASGIDDSVYNSSDTWAHRKLIIGNPYPCENFFKYAVKGKPGTNDKGGDIPKPNGKGFFRKVIKIRAVDSPNVRLAMAQQAAGMEVTGEVMVPGVKDWDTYCKHRLLWDPQKQSIGLDAEFWEGADTLMFPPHWLNQAEQWADRHKAKLTKRIAKAIGVDTAEGGDSSVWTAVDEFGIIEQHSIKTPDTSKIPGITLDFMRRHGCEPEYVMFDSGGGGKEHADRLRSMGYKVRTVAFGEAASSVDRFKRMKTTVEKRDDSEVRYIYKNKRAEMYGIARQLLDPANGSQFGMPEQYYELRRQLSLLPLMYDGEGRLELPPKTKRDPKSTKVCLKDILGCSPDEADSFVVAVYSMFHKPSRTFAGVVR